MTDNTLTVNDLYLMIGQREVEKYQLNWKIGQLQQDVAQLKKERDGDPDPAQT